MVARWIKGSVGDVAPTFGFKIETLLYQSPRMQDPHFTCTLHLWDIGGQKTIRSYWRNYYEETDGLVFVIDAAAPHRLEESLAELRALLDQDRLANASVLVLANKQDCPGAMGVEEMAQVLRLEDICGSSSSSGNGNGSGSGSGKERGRTAWRLIGCSAVTGENVDEALAWLVDDIASRIYHLQLLQK